MTATVNDTHHPRRKSWVGSANDGETDFPIQNLPYGVFRRSASDAPRIGVAIGDQIVDLIRCDELKLFKSLSDRLRASLRSPSLNELMALDAAETLSLRRQLITLLSEESGVTDGTLLVPMRDAQLLMPVQIGDYTDFYASIFHATRVGSLFRPDNPLLPNYKHVPIAYHGRASSIVVSGAAIARPSGQVKGAADQPEFRPTSRLDYEAEIGFFVRSGNRLGDPIPIGRAEDAIFGVCLVNDWSARDIQSWEYQPLGPFLAKNFATTTSPWVVSLEALAPFRTASLPRPAGDPAPLPYLSATGNHEGGAIDMLIDVLIQTPNMRRQNVNPVQLSRSSFREMYWTLAQMVTHHTSNGCNLRPGDLLASGTVSGSRDGSQACLLELTRGGKQPFDLPSGEQRTFLEDGDTITMRAYCERAGYVRIGFGECTGTIAPARKSSAS